MVNNLGKLFILFIFGAVLTSLTHAATEQECISKYDAPSTEPSTPDLTRVLRFECGMSCHNSTFKQEAIDKLKRKGLNMDENIFNAMCQRVEKTTENDEALQRCSRKFGAPETAPTNKQSIEYGKFMCALYCSHPEWFKTIRDLSGKTIAQQNAVCEPFESGYH